MKNFYEMEQEDKNKKRKEFKETTYGKHVYYYRNIGLYALFIVIFGTVFIELLYGFMGIENFEIPKGLEDLVDFVLVLAIIEFVIFEIISKIAFMRWLKIKYKIEY